MSNKAKVSIITLLIFISVITVGCSSKKYDAFRKDFTTTYFQVANSIDIRHTLDSLKNLQSEKNKKDINKLKDLLENIKDNVPSGMKKDYEMLNEWYQGMTLLRDSYSKWDKLSSDDKGRVLSEIMGVSLRKEDWDKKK